MLNKLIRLAYIKDDENDGTYVRQAWNLKVPYYT